MLQSICFSPCLSYWHFSRYTTCLPLELYRKHIPGFLALQREALMWEMENLSFFASNHRSRVYHESSLSHLPIWTSSLCHKLGREQLVLQRNGLCCLAGAVLRAGRCFGIVPCHLENDREAVVRHQSNLLFSTCFLLLGIHSTFSQTYMTVFRLVTGNRHPETLKLPRWYF